MGTLVTKLVCKKCNHEFESRTPLALDAGPGALKPSGCKCPKCGDGDAEPPVKNKDIQERFTTKTFLVTGKSPEQLWAYDEILDADFVKCLYLTNSVWEAEQYHSIKEAEEFLKEHGLGGKLFEVRVETTIIEI
jgi:rubredoxin